MGYRYNESNPDVWINKATTYNGTDYYKYMLVYVNDVLNLAKGTQEYMLKLNKVYILREGFGPTDRYIGANLDKVQLEGGRNVLPITCV